MSEERFGEYALVEKLGSGDMGSTYRATHPAQPDPMALKILDKVDMSNAMRRGSAVEVLEVSQTITHPRLHPISQVIELSHADGSGAVGVVMPLAVERSLAEALAQGKKYPGKAGLKIIAQLASALQFLHEQELAHGSLKPSNVLLDAEGNVTLTDLPMASLRELGFVPKQPTKQHLFFMIPEREYHAPPDAKGDVFSLGVLTYLLLVGKMPFNDPDPDARQPVEGGGLPPAMAAVLRRQLNPRARFRYETLEAFMTALKEATQGKVDPETERLFGVAPPPPPPPPGKK